MLQQSWNKYVWYRGKEDEQEEREYKVSFVSILHELQKTYNWKRSFGKKLNPRVKKEADKTFDELLWKERAIKEKARLISPKQKTNNVTNLNFLFISSLLL